MLVLPHTNPSHTRRTNAWCFRFLSVWQFVLYDMCCVTEGCSGVYLRETFMDSLLSDDEKINVHRAEAGRASEQMAAMVTACPNPQCEVLLEINSNENYPNNQARCLQCSHSICVMCKGVAHEGPCHDDQFVETEECKKCPGCHVVVMREDGCNHMTCTCGTKFCIICGQSSDAHDAAKCTPEGQRYMETHQQMDENAAAEAAAAVNAADL